MKKKKNLSLLAGALLSVVMADAGAAVLAGNGARATDFTGVAVGDTSFAGGVDAIAVGDTSTAAGDETTAVGGHARAMAASATSLGAAAQALAKQSLALGANAMASFDNSVALGAGSVTLFGAQTGYAAFGLGAPQSSTGEVNIGNRTLSSVAAGRDDQDAVNVAQLKAVAGKFDNDLSALGDQLTTLIGDTVRNITVDTSNPLFSADGSPDTEVANASGAHSVAAGASAQASGSNAVALGAAANASADNSVALGQGSVADRANTVSVGAAGQERQIANVAPGVEGTDAVNVNQLNSGLGGALGQAKAYTDDQVRSARKDSYGGAAAAIAMAGLPQAVLPGRGMVAMSAGTYGGQSAMAVGLSQLSETGKWAYKLQGTASTRGEFGGSVGAGMHW
jgi:trimeric autotransporter adhesin